MTHSRPTHERRSGLIDAAGATSAAVLLLALTACGHAAPPEAAPPMSRPMVAVVGAAVVTEAPAHTTHPSATPPAPVVAPTAVPAEVVPTAAPDAGVRPLMSSQPPVTTVRTTPAPAAGTTVKAAPANPAPTPAAAPVVTPPAVAPASARPTSFHGVPILYADPDGFPGAWGTASSQAIWVYPAAPARYVPSVTMHEYIHVLEFRAGWKDVASTHGERVADAGEQLLGGSYFKYTHGSPTAAELAEARALLAG